MKQAEIRRLLPAIFARAANDGSPLYTVLAIMELLHEPSERVLQNLDSYFDPYRAPDSFMPYLAGWVDLDQLLVSDPAELAGGDLPLYPAGLGRLRELVAAAAFLAKWRGTAVGLMQFLQIATGVKGFQIEETPPGPDGQRRPFHINVLFPSEAAPYEHLVRRIIELEKPAHVTYDLLPGPNA